MRWAEFTGEKRVGVWLADPLWFLWVLWVSGSFGAAASLSVWSGCLSKGCVVRPRRRREIVMAG